jgi:Cu2+-exporting ATPase
MAGKIQVKVKEKGGDTVASRIVTIIDQAANYKVDVQSSGEKIADKMVLPTMGLGAVGMAVSGSSSLLAILNADFGTGIRVAAPVALLASLGHAAQSGVLIKDGKVFELLDKIDVVLFDKTGTLTADTPHVSHIFLGETGHTEDEILRFTASAEQKFSHPIARAILICAKERQLEIPEHDDSKYHVGLGIEVMVEGNLIQVGSARYIAQQEISLTPQLEEALAVSREQGMGSIMVAIDGKIAGLIELRATIREEACDVISLLRARGIKEIVLISGDHDAPTKKLSEELGIDRYFASVMPHEKADYVTLLQEEGKKVMMVGDGINDSAALSLADIAVSLKGASTIAVDVADIVFMEGGLSKFSYLYEASDVLQKNVKRSFSLIAIPNSLCILGGLFGVFGLTSSLILNNGFNIIATLNGTAVTKEMKQLEKK